jgi:hypothetical protein
LQELLNQIINDDDIMKEIDKEIILWNQKKYLMD